MKKQKLNLKLNLKLNKQVVSKLNEKKIVGGTGSCGCRSDWLCMRTEAPWACQTENCPTAGGPSICGGIQHG